MSDIHIHNEHDRLAACAHLGTHVENGDMVTIPNEHERIGSLGADSEAVWYRMAPLTFAEAAQACWQTAEDHGWHEDVAVPAACKGWAESDLEHAAHDKSILHPALVAGQTFGDRIALIHSEASEALEAFRDGYAPTETRYEGKDGTKPCGVPSELADIVIRVLDLAVIYDIDIAAAISEKMAYNETREFRHGGKKL